MVSLRERSLRLTMVLIVASTFLIGPSLAGVGASWPFIGLLVAVSVGLSVVRPELTELPTLLGQDMGRYGQDLWLAPGLAAILVVAVDPAASAGELQTLGGVLGFLGVLNYFIRPAYLYLYGLGRRSLGDGGRDASQQPRPDTRGQTPTQSPVTPGTDGTDQDPVVGRETGASTDAPPRWQHNGGTRQAGDTATPSQQGQRSGTERSTEESQEPATDTQERDDAPGEERS